MSENAELPEGSTPVKKKSKLKFFVILLSLLLLLGGGGVGAYWFITQNPQLLASIFPSGDGESAASGGGAEGANGDAASTKDGEASGEGATGVTAVSATYSVNLPPLTINLADTGLTRYLRVGIDIEVSTQEAVTNIENQSAKIRDAIIILLSSKTYSNLASAEGKFQLKNEIAARINQILGMPRVIQVYFTDFVVQ